MHTNMTHDSGRADMNTKPEKGSGYAGIPSKSETPCSGPAQPPTPTTAGAK